MRYEWNCYVVDMLISLRPAVVIQVFHPFFLGQKVDACHLFAERADMVLVLNPLQFRPSIPA